MDTFFLRLAVAVIPLVVLVAAVVIGETFSARCCHHPISWHRRRRSLHRSLAAGAMLR